jgi:hypothetical protein
MNLDGIVPPLIVAGVGLAFIAFKRFYLGRAGPAAMQADAAIVALLIFVMALIELQMGRPATYRHGPVRVWSGVIASDQNSQQVADPYTFSHLVHGALFYGLTRLAMRRASPGLQLIVATMLETAWEVYENTDTVVQRYRTATIAAGYFGDSILNSVADVFACLAGFALARRLPWMVTMAWVIAVEVVLAVWIRDNLTLNILMLIHPIPAIRRWQLGA